ncbi:MAG TPA: hypothetical protein VML55_09320 [Planctomycetaceae bacterium]|nr:hypothetical protein [Planctomycetaceae bacterium]
MDTPAEIVTSYDVLPAHEGFLWGQAIASRGLTLVLSIRDRDAVRLPGLRSLADPPQPLEGPWSGP